VRQIGLPFDWAGRGGSGAFLVSSANEAAARHIEAWRDWSIPVSVLSGPPRSGRSALGAHFVRLSGGVVLDDVEAMADEVLFHAWNRALDTGAPLLLIAKDAPVRWTMQLPDLRSRLAAAHHVRIEEPDDMLVRALVEAGLAQAGSAFTPDLPEWLSHRIERSYSSVAAVLACLNHASLSSGRKISVLFAKEALQRVGFLPIVYDEREVRPQDKD
jgi:hypothetical protein